MAENLTTEFGEPLSHSTAEQLIHSSSPEELRAVASHPALTEDLALAFLKRTDLPSETIELLSRNGVVKFRRVKLAIVANPKAPRFVTIALIRRLFTFDLMQVALTPAVAGDLKRIAEETLINRLETLPSGERLTLARRASGAVAAALLSDGEPRVIQAALDNSRITEPHVVKAVMGPKSTAALVRAVCEHAKWSLRPEVRIALLWNETTPPAHACEIARTFPLRLVRELAQAARLPVRVRSLLLSEAVEREKRGQQSQRSAPGCR